MLGGFHFINRIADLVGIESKLPIVQRRFRWLRSFGFHARPADPVGTPAFVDTRYPARTTDVMVDAELTDFFIAISIRNAFERVDRLLA